MLKKIAAIFLTLTALLFSLLSVAQDTMADSKVEMAEGLRSNGKIYVVVAVLVTILAGIVLYIIRLDRKISKLESRKP